MHVQPLPADRAELSKPAHRVRRPANDDTHHDQKSKKCPDRDGHPDHLWIEDTLIAVGGAMAFQRCGDFFSERELPFACLSRGGANVSIYSRDRSTRGHGRASSEVAESVVVRHRNRGDDVFAGQSVGVTQVAERTWLVTFMHYDLGYFDDETCRLEAAIHAR